MSEGENVAREVLIEASPEEVWDALITEEGRERWLGDEHEPARAVEVEVEVAEDAEERRRLVWWWSRDKEPATRVEILVVAAPAGARVIVTETLPGFPLALLARCFALVAA